MCGVGYIFFGALGVSTNAAVLPGLMREYAAADPRQRATVEAVFSAVATATMVGSWGIFVRVLGGVYWLGIGTLLRQERRRLGYFTMSVGLFALLGVIGNVFQIGPINGVGTLGYLLGVPAWAVWLGLILYRNPTIDPITPPPPNSRIAHPNKCPFLLVHPKRSTNGYRGDLGCIRPLYLARLC